MGLLAGRKRVLTAAVEDPIGTPETVGAADVLSEDCIMDPTSEFIERGQTGLYLGPTVPGVVTSRLGKCSFRTEFQFGTGATIHAGLVPLFQACGLKQTSTAIYNTHSSYADQEAATLSQYIDGFKKQIYGAMGTLTFEGEVGRPVYCNFDFQGLWAQPSDTALPSFAPSTSAPALLASATLTFGGTTFYCSKFTLDLGNNVIMRPSATGTGGYLHALITNYNPTITLDPELELDATEPFYSDFMPDTVGSLSTSAAISLVISNGSYQCTFSLPVVQCTSITESDRDDIAALTWIGRAMNKTSDGTTPVTLTIAAVA